MLSLLGHRGRSPEEGPETEAGGGRPDRHTLLMMAGNPASLPWQSPRKPPIKTPFAQSTCNQYKKGVNLQVEHQLPSFFQVNVGHSCWYAAGKHALACVASYTFLRRCPGVGCHSIRKGVQQCSRRHRLADCGPMNHYRPQVRCGPQRLRCFISCDRSRSVIIAGQVRPSSSRACNRCSVGHVSPDRNIYSSCGRAINRDKPSSSSKRLAWCNNPSAAASERDFQQLVPRGAEHRSKRQRAFCPCPYWFLFTCPRPRELPTSPAPPRCRFWRTMMSSLGRIRSVPARPEASRSHQRACSIYQRSTCMASKPPGPPLWLRVVVV